MILIGDVHGKLDAYLNIIENVDKSIQIGDFGFKLQHEWFLENIDFTKHKILFGNHDYYPYLNREHSVCTTHYFENDVMYIRGAFSLDWKYRMLDRDYFLNEELTYLEGLQVIEDFEKFKPRIVVSHDCPDSISKTLYVTHIPTITGNILQECFEVHQPELWVFGHHHKSFEMIVGKTKFKCLNELETFEI